MKQLIHDYFVLLIPSFLITGSLWSIFVDGKLYYCSDPLPILDIIPPFVHNGFGDHWISSPGLVYGIWACLMLLMLTTPLLAVKKLERIKPFSGKED